MYNRFSAIINFISLFFVSSLLFLFIFIFVFLKLNITRKVKSEKIKDIFISIENEMKSFSTKNIYFLLLLLSVSLIYWFLRLFMGYLVLNMLGINLSFFTISFISLSVFILSLIPLYFVAGFGITEVGFLFFLTQLSFEYNSTLIIILIYHIYLLIPVLVYGIVGKLSNYFSSNKL